MKILFYSSDSIRSNQYIEIIIIIITQLVLIPITKNIMYIYIFIKFLILEN